MHLPHTIAIQMTQKIKTRLNVNGKTVRKKTTNTILTYTKYTTSQLIYTQLIQVKPHKTRLTHYHRS